MIAWLLVITVMARTVSLYSMDEEPPKPPQQEAVWFAKGSLGNVDPTAALSKLMNMFSLGGPSDVPEEVSLQQPPAEMRSSVTVTQVTALGYNVVSARDTTFQPTAGQPLLQQALVNSALSSASSQSQPTSSQPAAAATPSPAAGSSKAASSSREPEVVLTEQQKAIRARYAGMNYAQLKREEARLIRRYIRRPFRGEDESDELIRQMVPLRQAITRRWRPGDDIRSAGVYVAIREGMPRDGDF